MLKNSAMGFIALIALAIQGCGAAASEGDPGESEAALGECGAFSQSFYSISSPGDVLLKPSSTHFCWLTKSSGNFDGGNGYTGLFVQTEGDGSWHLVSSGPGGSGEARCTPLSCFSGDGVNDVVWMSNGRAAIASSSRTGTCDHYSNDMWWGDAASVLTAHPGSGRTAGGGEYADVTLSSSAFSPSTVNAGDCVGDSKPIIANAVSLFVGTPSGGKVPHYTGTPFATWGTFTLNLGVYTDDAFCFFTHITGGFRGGGESVRLFTQYEASSGRYLWYAQTTQGGAGNQVRGEGRCYYYHQWDL